MTASQTSFSRRTFCKYAVSAGVAMASFSALSRVATFAAENGGFALPPLPYAEDALAPHISSEFGDFLRILALSLDLCRNRFRIVILLLTRTLLNGRTLHLFGEIVSVRFVIIQEMLY